MKPYGWQHGLLCHSRRWLSGASSPRSRWHRRDWKRVERQRGAGAVVAEQLVSEEPDCRDHDPDSADESYWEAVMRLMKRLPEGVEAPGEDPEPFV